jgi:hypothetical protein
MGSTESKRTQRRERLRHLRTLKNVFLVSFYFKGGDRFMGKEQKPKETAVQKPGGWDQSSANKPSLTSMPPSTGPKPKR